MRGSIIKRGKKYTIVLEMGIDPSTKKRKQKWISGFTKKRQAEEELARLVSEVNKGIFVEPSKSTLEEYLEKWLEIHKASIAERTYHRYEQLTYGHIIPLLGSMLLSKLKPMHIQQFLSRMQTRERLDSRKGTLSPTTIHHAHNVLHKALKDAVKWQMVPVNPSDAVTPPRRARKVCRVAEEEEIPVILHITKDTYLEVPVFLALSTGARVGEILGLQWNDVDLKKGIIHIRSAMIRKKDGTLVLAQVKTPKSRRAVEIGPDTISKLKQHNKQQKEWQVASDKKWNTSNLVCIHSDDGRPINPNALSSRFNKLMTKQGLNLSFHDLRHTHATMLLKSGVHPKIVSERLGHANIGMTLDIYSHVLPTMQKEAAGIMEGYLK